jgi:hypothetical protein
MDSKQNKSELFQYQQLTAVYTQEELENLILALNNIFEKYDQTLLEDDAPIRLNDRGIPFAFMILILQENQNTKYIHEHNINKGYKHAIAINKIKEQLMSIEELSSITFRQGNNTFTVDDPIVLEWIDSLITKAVDNFNLPSDLKGARFSVKSISNPVKRIDSATLESHISRRPISMSKVIYYICKGVINYMNSAFKMRQHNALYFSDRQIAFLYEILSALKIPGYECPFDVNFNVPETDIDKLSILLRKQES